MKNYDPTQIIMTVGGARIRGFASDEFVKWESESDAFSDDVGADSEVTRSKSGDERATCTVILMQSSDSNDLLSAAHNLDKASPNGAGVFAVRLEDLQGRSLHAGAECWVMKAPDVSYAKTPKPREWKIRVANEERFDGGEL